MNPDLLHLIAGYASPPEAIMIIEALNKELLFDEKFLQHVIKLFPERVESCQNPSWSVLYRTFYSDLFLDLFAKNYFLAIHFLVKTLPLSAVYYITHIPDDFYASWLLEEKDFEKEPSELRETISSIKISSKTLNLIMNHPSFGERWLTGMISEAFSKDDSQRIDMFVNKAGQYYSQSYLQVYINGRFIHSLCRDHIDIVEFYCKKFVEDFKTEGLSTHYQISPFTKDFIASRDDWFEYATPKTYFYLLDFLAEVHPSMKAVIQGDRVDIPPSIMTRYGENLCFIKELFARAKGYKYNMKIYIEPLLKNGHMETLYFILSIFWSYHIDPKCKCVVEGEGEGERERERSVILETLLKNRCKCLEEISEPGKEEKFKIVLQEDISEIMIPRYVD